MDETTATGTHRPLGQHPHTHDRFCGHAAVPHDDHVDFLHDGHVHHVHDDHVDEAAAAASSVGPPMSSTPPQHVPRAGCGHAAYPTRITWTTCTTITATRGITSTTTST